MPRPVPLTTMVRLFICLVAAMAGCPATAVLGQRAEQRDEMQAGETPMGQVSFSRDVLPILSDNCFHCHGPDENHREADLRLDTQAGAMAVIEPGNPEQSEFLKRVLASGEHEDERMPPTDSNKSLTPPQKNVLRDWIRQGAPWGQHWAFEPLRAPQLPDLNATPAATWPRQNWVDSYVQARLLNVAPPGSFASNSNSNSNSNAPGVGSPSPEADRRTLIRRLSLDLRGLPPTPEEVVAFVNDQRPGAYARLVDRLLASPELGERMAWNWLDAARYADSNGYQGDRERTMWPWRDWVVDAFNRDLPFDEFTVWQLAGDLLPDATFEQQLATGFCRNHMINGEGGRIPEENRVDYVMDMTETMGTVWLGLTLNCCRCHDHKFDPLKRREYYQLFAFFNQTPVNGGGGDPQTPPVLAAPTLGQQRKLDQLQRELQTLGKQLEQRRETLAREQAKWEEGLKAEGVASPWTPLEVAAAKAEHQSLKVLDDQSVLAGGKRAANDNYELTLQLPTGSVETTVTAIRLEALKHPSHTEGSLSRSGSGNFVLTDISMESVNDKGVSQPITFRSAKATFEQGGHTAAAAIDKDPKSGWAVYEGRTVDREHALLLVLEQPLKIDATNKLRVRLRHDSPHDQHNLGRFRFASSGSDSPQLQAAADWQLALQAPPTQRTPAQAKAVAAAHQNADAEHKRLADKQQQLQKQRDSLNKSLPKVMVMADRGDLRKTHMLDRGLYNKLQEEVTANVPAAFPQLPSSDQPSPASDTATPQPPNRLALAEWLVANEHPLTARVVVNRFWQQIFGAGLVKTTEDFGVQGERPSHPELLDALAWKFQREGWETKRLLRAIVMSHTYRQRSSVSAAATEWDSSNRWLGRGPRFRMPSWMLRDQALAAAGLLVRRQGGPAVNSYQPPGVWEEATFGKKKYTQDHGAAVYRRSLYTFWRRIIAPTMFFDNASRQTCTVKPFRTNTPLHALLTLNDVTYVEAARALAQQLLQSDAPSDRERLDRAMLRLTARAASEQEARILLASLADSVKHYRERPQAAASLLSHGEHPRDEALDAAIHAGWTAACLALMNLDETLTKE